MKKPKEGSVKEEMTESASEAKREGDRPTSIKARTLKTVMANRKRMGY